MSRSFRWALIGHRGVGKTSLLERLGAYAKKQGLEIPLIDLDRAVEQESGENITQIFNSQGEKYFRQLELKTYEKIVKTHSHFIVALGAGFDLSQVNDPVNVEKIWIRRKTDSLGRIFLDRPRLNPQVDVLEEYLQRFQERESLYEKKSHWIYDLPEGLDHANSIEEELFFNKIQNIGGFLTLMPYHLQRLSQVRNRYFSWGLDAVEFRDDLLSSEQIEKLSSEFKEQLRPEQRLLSFRKATSALTNLELSKQGFMVDWAVELGLPPERARINYFSMHHRGASESLRDCLGRLNQWGQSFQSKGKVCGLKLAVPVHSFEELKTGLEWWQEDPQTRNFLPQSKETSWGWVRLWLKGRQSINFWREGSGSSVSQPNLYEWLSTPVAPKYFAAVIGDPVEHSRTPLEQQDFFARQSKPVFRVQMDQTQALEGIDLLKSMGLQACAVTAPLKKEVFKICDQVSDLAEELGSINTLFFSEDKILGENTDFVGFQKMFAAEFENLPLPQAEIVVWGGGGTLPVIQKVLPKAIFYSAQSAEPRANVSATDPKILIWAAAPKADLPPTDWHPKVIIDLNYREDSSAKAYSLQVGAKYLSGLPMFKTQAKAQQDFWQRNPKERGS